MWSAALGKSTNSHGPKTGRKWGIHRRFHGNLWLWKMMIHRSMQWGTRFHQFQQKLVKLDNASIFFNILQYVSTTCWLSMQLVQFMGGLTTARPTGWSTCAPACATRLRCGQIEVVHSLVTFRMFPVAVSGWKYVVAACSRQCPNVPSTPEQWWFADSMSGGQFTTWSAKNALLCFGNPSTGKEPPRGQPSFSNHNFASEAGSKIGVVQCPLLKRRWATDDLRSLVAWDLVPVTASDCLVTFSGQLAGLDLKRKRDVGDLFLGRMAERCRKAWSSWLWKWKLRSNFYPFLFGTVPTRSTLGLFRYTSKTVGVPSDGCLPPDMIWKTTALRLLCQV